MLQQDGTTFAGRAIASFAHIYSAIVRQVPSGVVATRTPPDGAPLLVVGGGSGHYPAFAGYVGSGLAAAAVLGDVFASPSEAAIVGVVRDLAPAGDVILGYGNYAGDRLNFNAAAAELEYLGYRVRHIVVTDDVASSPQHNERRGIAGDLIVFKICGAGILRGAGLDEAVTVAARANSATRTIGVAFSGCTIPGAPGPLFTVNPGEIALGLGIHGEPGIETLPVPTESELAGLLVDRVTAELPARRSPRLGVLLNGMGSAGPETLFAIWPLVLDELQARGYQSIAPLVGSYVSSLDMTGLSLSVCQLDDELEALWLDPAHSAAVHRPDGEVAERPPLTWRPTSERLERGGLVAEVFDYVVAVLERSEQELGALDALAGDGDHGRGMLAGARAARDACGGIHDIGAALTAAGKAWAARAGGTSGALWEAMLTSAAKSVDPSRPHFSLKAAAAAAATQLAEQGGARLGDKTMLDAVAPFASALDAPGPPAVVWRQAAAVARNAAERTSELIPRLGRARTHPGRSLGHPDAGAMSFALIVEEVGRWMESRS
ncbi:dihydroxyacetone kinase family protein [Acrocarpospora pleiomorpha]